MNDPTPHGDRNEPPATDSGAGERQYGVSEQTTGESHAGTSPATAPHGDGLSVPPAFDTARDDDNPLEKLAKRLGFLDIIRAHPVLGWMYRAGVAVVGGFVVIVGVILIPAPGPGWLIVFAGLGILATEFAWAQRLLDHAKSRVAAWTRWIMKQRLWVRCAFGLAGAILLVILAILSLHSLGWDSALFT